MNSRAYQEWILNAQRWDKAVDFASPITAWTPAMLAQKRKEDEDVAPRGMAT